MNAIKSDPEKYARMSRPFPSKDEATAAVEAFLEKIGGLRESYRIAEVVVIASVYVPDDENDGKEALETFITYGDLGAHFQMLDRTRNATALHLAKAASGCGGDIDPLALAEKLKDLAKWEQEQRDAGVLDGLSGNDDERGA